MLNPLDWIERAASKAEQFLGSNAFAGIVMAISVGGSLVVVVRGALRVTDFSLVGLLIQFGVVAFGIAFAIYAISYVALEAARLAPVLIILALGVLAVIVALLSFMVAF